MSRPKNPIELLQDLVAIPSVNPQGNPDPTGAGEGPLAEYVAEFLRALGAEVVLDPVEPDRPNVIATFAPAPSSAPAPRIAFAPHLDTVSVTGMDIAPFDPVVRDGKLWGRGSSDTKGPMAAALWALREWAQSSSRSRSRIHWTFLALMGEETGSQGANALARRGFTSDLVLALEPTELKVVSAHKGLMWLDIITHGVACHGSTPEKGRNSISAMRQVLEILEEKILPGLSERTHPKLGRSSMNIGTISGGSKINIVPDRCHLEVDCRLVPGVEVEALFAQIGAELRAELPDIEIRLQRTLKALDTDESLPWVKRLGAHAEGFTTAPWGSDAAALSTHTCHAVCIGPGSISQAHTKDEFIRVRDFEDGVDFFSRWITAAEADPDIHP